MNNRQVAHIWANQSKPKATGSNFYFEGTDIFSYGSHYMAGRIHTVKGIKVALVNSTNCSISTCKHQNYTLDAVRGLMPYLYVSQVTDIKAALKEAVGLIDTYYSDELKRKKVDNNRAYEWFLERISFYLKQVNDFSQAVRFKSIYLNDKKLAAVKKHLESRYARYLELNTPENVAKREAEKIKRNEKKHATAIEKFRAGESIRDINTPFQLLRIVGDEIETSRGARVPLQEGKAFIKVMQSGKSVEGLGIGNFTFSGRETLSNGDTVLKIGCHRILLSEAVQLLGKDE